MALPALSASGADSMVVRSSLARLLHLAFPRIEVTPLERGIRGMVPVTRVVRRGSFARGILLTPSLSSALLFRLGGVTTLRGSGTDRRESLLDDVVPRSAIDADHRTVAYWLLVTGSPPSERPIPTLEVPRALLADGRDRVGANGRAVVGVFPGGNAASRRWPAARFSQLVTSLTDAGIAVVVFGGPAERGLTRFVAGRAGMDLGGATDLPMLAATLAACDILVSNDSGPLHLAAAVGTPTVSLWGAGNPDVTGVTGRQHRLLRRDDLACVPCVRNTCPRRGAGFILPDAVNECLALIEAEEVLKVVRQVLAT